MDAIICRRHQFLVWTDGGLFVNAHHERNARSIDIAIEQTNAGAEMPQTTRDVHRRSAFTHAAFAAGHRDNAFYSGNFILVRPWIRRAGSGSPGASHID